MDNDLKADTDIKFYINDVEHSVRNTDWNNGYLVDFLRDRCSLTGTKYMCRAGGCGACVVTVMKYDNVEKKNKAFAVNSVDSYKGYHEIQTRLAENNGTQCGYCTPGMVMNMYSLLQNKKIPTTREIEDSFDGNICRCTGYRPILTSMKSFGVPELKDIEDLHDWDTCEETFEESVINVNDLSICTPLKAGNWWRPRNLKELIKIVNDVGFDKVKLVVGNTGQGIFEDEKNYDFFIDMKTVTELNQYTTSGTFTVGANITLNQVIQLFTQQKSKYRPSYEYCEALVSHLKFVANIPVRNVGCWAGNLILKRKNNGFQSDVFTLWEAAGIQITLCQLNGKEKVISPLDLLDENKGKGIIKNMILPKHTNQHSLVTFKVKHRHQNSHAYVNAAFLFKLDSDFKFLSEPSLVYGGVSPTFVHANETERILLKKNLLQETTLHMVLNSLQNEVVPNNDPILSEPRYRKLLSCALLYKAFLKLAKGKLDIRYVSGGEDIVRPLSTGSQDFPTNRSEWPLTEPLVKIEAKPQVAGELTYTTDIPRSRNTVYGYFVTSAVGKATLDKIDASEALKMTGVIRFFTHKDIPGHNTVTVEVFRISGVEEELFCSGKILYAGQPIGLMVADTFEHAKAAAKKVKIKYSNIKQPVITIEDAIEKGRIKKYPLMTKKRGNAEAILNKTKNKISGEVQSGQQYPFYMETMVACSSRTFDGVHINVSTQWVPSIQDAVSELLNLDRNKIQVPSQYVGGAYGGKLLNPIYPAGASAIAATLLNQPVYVQLDLETCMKMLGFRNALMVKYEAAVESDGIIKALKLDFYLNGGSSSNFSLFAFLLILKVAENVYNFENMLFTPHSVITDTPANQPTRAPGSATTHFAIEYIMEHLAFQIGIDPIEFRRKNMLKHFPHPTLENLSDEVYSYYYDFDKLFNSLMNSAEVEKRKKEIIQFNKDNIWRKRGISVVPLKFDLEYMANLLNFNAVVTIFNGGGSVIVEHGGIEMGQGINTKVAQVTAHQLKIPVDLVSVKLTTNIVMGNAFWTGGSASSELVCQAVIQCCRTLLNRIAPVKTLLPFLPWDKVIDACYLKGVDLTAESHVGISNYPKAYSIYGAGCTEAEVDVLTGQTQINRSDILYDAGNCISPYVDLGQAEGAFVMGLGYFLTEQIRFDPKTGINLTHNTWEYFPPSSKDIPVDLRISLLKNAPNPLGVLSSKATGEPPLVLSDSAFYAVKSAIAATRQEHGKKDWVHMDQPATPEKIFLSCDLDVKDFVLKKKTDDEEQK